MATPLPETESSLTHFIRGIVVHFQYSFYILEAKKVLVILTDSRSNTGMVSGTVQQLRNAGVVIFSVGIGKDISLPELYTMASEPKDEHFVHFEDLSQPSTVAERWAFEACNGKCKKDLL